MAGRQFGEPVYDEALALAVLLTHAGNDLENYRTRLRLLNQPVSDEEHKEIMAGLARAAHIVTLAGMNVSANGISKGEKEYFEWPPARKPAA